jgi:hypothetical protein
MGKRFRVTGHRGESTNALQAIFGLNRRVNAGPNEGFWLRWGSVTRAIAPLMAALALIFGAAGCGDDSDEFKDQYNEAVRPLSALGDEVAASLAGAEGQSEKAIADRFDELADRSERAGEKLSRLEPPEDAEAEFDELLVLLKEGIADLRAVARAAREGDPAEAEEATETLVETGQRLRQAEDEFQDAVN